MSKNTKNIILKSIGIIILCLFMVFIGYISACKTFKTTTNISVDTNDIVLHVTCDFNNCNTQVELDEQSLACYKEYHKYFEQVVKRIKQYSYNDSATKNAVMNYIKGYDKRKNIFDKAMFPNKNATSLDDMYGSIFGTVYYQGMMNFDRQELLAYEMILTNMYFPLNEDDIKTIFAK